MEGRILKSVLLVLFALFALSPFSWADISVQISPDAAITAGAQWRIDGGEWLASGETAAGVPDGWRQVEFKALSGWTEPAAISVFSVSGALSSESVSYKALPHFNLGEIPPQTVWHGNSLKLYAHSTGGGSVSYTVDPLPAGAITFDAATGFFVYSPVAGDKFPFTVTFGSAGNNPPSQTVRISPMPNLPPEQSVFGAETPSPTPVDEKDIRIETKDNPAEDFNYVNRPTQDVRIVGQVVVFQEGHENELYETYNENPAIKNLEIDAKSVIIRSPLHLPQTNVTINAQELKFEDSGAVAASLSTTPISLDTPPGPTWIHKSDNSPCTPQETSDVCYSKPSNGAHGLKAGDIHLEISSLNAPPGPTRFFLVGGKGQNPDPGRNGIAGTQMASVMSWHGRDTQIPVALVYAFYQYCGFFSCDDPDIFGTRKWPTDGEHAVAAGIPGNGGDGGLLTSTLEVRSLANFTGGQPGICEDPGQTEYGNKCQYKGGARGTPELSTMTHEDDSFWSGDYWYVDPLDGWNRQIYVDPTHTIIAHQTSDGANAYPTAGAAGNEGGFIHTGDYLAWLNPVNLRNLLNEIKDSYLDNSDPNIQQKLEEYVALLGAYKGRTAWSALTAAEQLELQGMADEMENLLHRIKNNLDYFGNPAGWVPMLSFEVNRTIFDNEIDRSIDILYLTYWLKERAEDLTQKLDALKEAREKIKAEIEDSKTKLTTATDLIPGLEIQAGEISNEIFSIQQELQALEQKLKEQAQENLKEPWWKTGLKIAGSLCKIIPVGQPALGAIGGGMDLVANFNPNDPWSTITGAADICSTFGSAKFNEASKELKKKVDSLKTGAEAEQNALEGAESLKDWTGAIAGGLKSVKDVLGKTQAPQSAVEAEIEKLKAQSTEFKEVSKKISGLLDKKMGFQQQLAKAMQDVAGLSNLITTDLLALDGMNRDASAGDNVLDDRALMYLNDMERRAKERLLKYHYFMAKAYEYRMLKPYDNKLNLDDLFDKFEDIATTNLGDPDRKTQAYILDADQFKSLKGIYEDKLAVVAEKIFTDYNSNPPELSVPVRFNLTQDELDRLNAGEPVKVNLVDIGLFPSSEENIRIVDFEVANIDSHLEDGDFSRWADLNLYIEHSGISNLEQNGKVMKFNHYNASTTNPIVWGARYAWYDDIVDPIQPSAASDSLLRSLLQSDMAKDMMLYSRPAAWTDLVFRKQVNSDNGADVVIDSLRLKLTYDFMRKGSAQSHLDVVVSDSAITPYFVVDTADVNHRQDGRGAFRRIYPRGQFVTVKAQERYGRLTFNNWTDRYGYDIAGQDPADPTKITVILGDDLAIMANYVSDDEEQFTISGDVKTAAGKGMSGVTITFSNEGGSVTTDSLGHYSQNVPYGWHGTVTPSKEAFAFSPAGRNFLPVVTDRGSQNFTVSPQGNPSLAATKTEIDLGDVNASESLLVWNKGTGTAYYTIAVIEGAEWFTVTPATGSSIGLDDKKLHMVTADRIKIPAGESRTGTLEISLDGATSPLYVHVSASNSSIIVVTKSTFKAGKGSNIDSFTLSGYFSATLQQIARATAISLQLWSPRGVIYEESLPLTSGKMTGSRYHYASGAATGEAGGITDFRFDLDRHTFSIKAKNIDLSGLENPVHIDLTIGDYNGLAEIPESVINEGAPLSVAFMSGLADLIRADAAEVRTNATGLDTLVVQGSMALASGMTDLTGVPVTVMWENRSFVIPAGQVRRQGQTHTYTVRLISRGSMIAAQFNLEACKFKITIRDTEINPKTGPVTLGIAIGPFNQWDQFTLP